MARTGNTAPFIVIEVEILFRGISSKSNCRIMVEIIAFNEDMINYFIIILMHLVERKIFCYGDIVKIFC